MGKPLSLLYALVSKIRALAVTHSPLADRSVAVGAVLACTAHAWPDTLPGQQRRSHLPHLTGHRTAMWPGLPQLKQTAGPFCAVAALAEGPSLRLRWPVYAGIKSMAMIRMSSSTVYSALESTCA